VTFLGGYFAGIGCLQNRIYSEVVISSEPADPPKAHLIFFPPLMLVAEEGDEYPVLKSSRIAQNVTSYWNIVQAILNTCIQHCNQFLNSNGYCGGGGD
jgi:hypothetical protein